MKATEIQIGDWVKLMNPKGEWIDNVKIDMNLFSIFLRDGEEGFIRFEPIPLTPGILEKNGFKKIDFSHYQINDRTLVLDADGKWDGELSWHWVVTEMSTNSKGQNVVLDYYVATINYVHELQRALRCCGLEELATNFKI